MKVKKKEANVLLNGLRKRHLNDLKVIPRYSVSKLCGCVCLELFRKVF